MTFDETLEEMEMALDGFFEEVAFQAEAWSAALAWSFLSLLTGRSVLVDEEHRAIDQLLGGALIISTVEGSELLPSHWEAI